MAEAIPNVPRFVRIGLLVSDQDREPREVTPRSMDTLEDGRLERAIEIAAIGHMLQLDKAGEPYILHVLRVLLACPKGDAQVVAALHDVVEDTPWRLMDIEADGFPDEVIEAVDALTRRDGESYWKYLDRVAANPLATVVKIADLQDNLILSRIPNPTGHDLRRWEKYRNALRKLGRTHAD